eukprot:m.203616 g.203616  ORF g.203616 m.203616 type:complete len:665 (+) comp15373_c0_seq6:616-2610(+)
MGSGSRPSDSVSNARWIVRCFPGPRCTKGSGTSVPALNRSSIPSSRVREQIQTDPSGAATTPGPEALNQRWTGIWVATPAGSTRSTEGEQSCAWKVLPWPSTALITGVGSDGCSWPPSPGNAEWLYALGEKCHTAWPSVWLVGRDGSSTVIASYISVKSASSVPLGTPRVLPLSATQTLQSSASRTEWGSDSRSPQSLPLCKSRGTAKLPTLCSPASVSTRWIWLSYCVLTHSLPGLHAEATTLCTPESTELRVNRETFGLMSPLGSRLNAKSCPVNLGAGDTGSEVESADNEALGGGCHGDRVGMAAVGVHTEPGESSISPGRHRAPQSEQCARECNARMPWDRHGANSSSSTHTTEKPASKSEAESGLLRTPDRGQALRRDGQKRCKDNGLHHFLTATDDMITAVLLLVGGCAVAADGVRLERARAPHVPHSPNPHINTSRGVADNQPVGNGEVVANVWGENGTIGLLLGRSDAFSSSTAALKLGRLFLDFEPGFLGGEASFTQTLDLATATVRATIVSTQGARVDVSVWSDVNSVGTADSVHVSINASEPIEVFARIDVWRTQLMNTTWQTRGPCGYQLMWPDTVVSSSAALPQGQVGWYHRNLASQYRPTLYLQRMQEFADKTVDPLLNRTSGGLVVEPLRLSRSMALSFARLPLRPSTP